MTFSTASSGLPNYPEFVASVTLDGILLGSCDTNKKTVEVKQDWVKTFLENNTDQLKWYTFECLEGQPNAFKEMISSLKRHFNQSGGRRAISCI